MPSRITGARRNIYPSLPPQNIRCITHRQALKNGDEERTGTGVISHETNLIGGPAGHSLPLKVKVPVFADDVEDDITATRATVFTRFIPPVISRLAQQSKDAR